jgi:hypothetical protein
LAHVLVGEPVATSPGHARAYTGRPGFHQPAVSFIAAARLLGMTPGRSRERAEFRYAQWRSGWHAAC